MELTPEQTAAAVELHHSCPKCAVPAANYGGRPKVIKTGKNAGQHPSVASLYRALADPHTT
ncbi:MAG: hypothetical protein ACRDR6_02475 [Pseudonocardiaceae bacterium]